MMHRGGRGRSLKVGSKHGPPPFGEHHWFKELKQHGNDQEGVWGRSYCEKMHLIGERNVVSLKIGGGVTRRSCSGEGLLI